jgi:hypothetical protein
VARGEVGYLVAQRAKQSFELIQAAVDIPDYVERAVLGAAVVPQRLADDLYFGYLLGRGQLVDVPETPRA